MRVTSDRISELPAKNICHCLFDDRLRERYVSASISSKLWFGEPEVATLDFSVHLSYNLTFLIILFRTIKCDKNAELKIPNDKQMTVNQKMRCLKFEKIRWCHLVTYRTSWTWVHNYNPSPYKGSKMFIKITRLNGVLDVLVRTNLRGRITFLSHMCKTLQFL